MEAQKFVNSSEYETYEQYEEFSSISGSIILGVKCTIILWTILINVLFVAALSSSGHLKKKCSCWFLLNLAVADLFVGLMVVPFSLYLEMSGYWHLGEIGCHIWIQTDVLLCSVSLFALFTINIDRIVFVLKPLTYTLVMGKAICVCLIAFSWLLAIGVTIPLVFTEQVHAADGNCYVALVPVFAIGSSAVTYFFPGLLVIITNICMVIIVFKKTRKRRRPSMHSNPSPEDRPTFIARGPLSMPTMVEARERASRDAKRKRNQAALVMCIVNFSI